MNRLLTRRDKNGTHKHRRSRSSEADRGVKSRPFSATLLSVFKAQEIKKPKEIDTKQVQSIKSRLKENGITTIEDSQIEYSLATKYSSGDEDKAYELLLLFQDSQDGLLRPYDPNVRMLGAENRENVTCWLDSVLFAMFARLSSFEPILYTNFEDEPRKQLSILIKLWVNMLRTGKLIDKEITQKLQEALKNCGWPEAAEICQNDASEAFSFITETLQLPLLTMEMDIFHAGGGDKDDHKIVNERLLEVAIPPPVEGKACRLEDCLEEHFNTRVEVMRRLERRDTLHSATGMTPVDEKKDKDVELSPQPEAVEIENSSITTSTTPQNAPASPTFLQNRHRAPSIVRRIVVEEQGEPSETATSSSPRGSIRKGAIRKEVLMPAWQFFRIIPWYTANVPANDDQVVSHFKTTRPVLGICLKRYAMSPSGQPIRMNTAVDIPLQIALPHFIQDDKKTDDGPLFGNFKLVLQSMVCHRGNSVHAGHYISLIRGLSKINVEDATARHAETPNGGPPEYLEDRWIKLDDLAIDRVTYVDIDEAMKHEMPYLLFYQVQPLYPDVPSVLPPAYEDSAIGLVVSEASPITSGYHSDVSRSEYFDGSVSIPAEEPPKGRTSLSDDANNLRKSLDVSRKSLNLSEADRGGSIVNTDTSGADGNGGSLPPTPGFPPATRAEEVQPQGRLARATSRLTRSSKSKSRPSSRPASQVDEGRKSSTFSRLNLMRSKDSLNKLLQDTSGSELTVASVGALEIVTSQEISALQMSGFASVPILISADGLGEMTQSDGKAVDETNHSHHHHHHLHLHHHLSNHSHDHNGGNGNEKTKAPERECTVM